MKKLIYQWMLLCCTIAFVATLFIANLLSKDQAKATPASTIASNRTALQGEALSSSGLQQLTVRPDDTASSLAIPVYLSKQQEVYSVLLEDYVRGVVSAEMPIDFELEALKAQAMAARTYIVRRVLQEDFSRVPVEEAWVTDTTTHQVYLNDEQLKERWPSDVYERNMAKVKQAVAETRGLILTYDEQPINATFFSTSNGYTENSEDYWEGQIPYLRSVESPWDQNISPRYTETVQLELNDWMKRLGVRSKQSAYDVAAGMKIVAMTTGKHVKELQVAGKVISGREVREKLDLKSSAFTWTLEKDRIAFTTYGYGHGVGMSQWGANGMAQAGASAEDIVKHYYTGISIGHVTSYLPEPN